MKLKSVKLNNFKCFEKLELELGQLNVFSGLNGMGKSTVNQSILMIKQSWDQNYMPDMVSLNGNLVKIGTGTDLLYENASSDKIVITLETREKKTDYVIQYKENPEAHLHPKGQRKMGELMARCAGNGVQVFAETHSDHVVNGIRIAVKNNMVDNGDVRLFFMEKSVVNDKCVHTVQEPKIYPNGKLDYWPEGFFDEWEKALV